MESEKYTSCVALDDIDIIKEIFKLSPEYGKFILAKARRTQNAIEEVIEEIGND